MATAKLKPCGTNAAYQRHIKTGEQPCDACVHAHQAVMQVYRQRYRDANPDKVRASARRWAADNREAVRTYGKGYREVHADKRAANQRAWRAANPGKVHAYRSTRRSGDTFTEAEWQDLLERCGHVCAYCAGPGPLEADHVVPVSKGGTNHIENMLPACRRCNASKGAKPLLVWLLQEVNSGNC